MHEASLVEALLRQVEDLMRQHGADRVGAVRVVVGEFSGVEPELLELAFDRLVENTPARGARLHVTRTPLTGECPRCSRKFVIERFCFVCPGCGGDRLVITGGEELVLDSVTMEVDE